MKYPLFDAHCDTIFEADRKGEKLRKNGLHIDLERGLKCFAPYAQVFAVWHRPEVDGQISENYEKDYPADVLVPEADRLLEKLLAEFAENSDVLVHCRSAADAKKAAEQGKIAAFIAIEGAELIDCDIKKLHEVYDKGVRFMNLCWNYDNAVCGAANGKEKYGLTDKGREFVKEMQSLGMAVDLSHASEKTFWDVMEIAEKPVLCGHSDLKTGCDNPRNITDEQFKALVENGGVMGINLCPEFLNIRAKADVNDIVRHVEHCISLGGKKNVCLGGDLDGIDTLPTWFDGIQDYYRIYETMLKRNWNEEKVNDIFYNNLMRFVEEAL